MGIPWAVILHTAAIYFCLILGLRFLGRRQLSQLTLVDLVIVVIMGSAVETSMVAANTSLLAGLCSAATLLLLDRLLSLLFFRSKRLRQLIGGVPVLLISEGRFLEEHLRRAGLTEADVLEAIRERGQANPDNVKFAVLEIDGEINVVTKETETFRGKRPVRAGTVAGL